MLFPHEILWQNHYTCSILKQHVIYLENKDDYVANLFIQFLCPLHMAQDFFIVTDNIKLDKIDYLFWGGIRIVSRAIGITKALGLGR